MSRAGAALLSALGAVCGCAPALTPADVSGAWRGDDGGTLTLGDSGSFVVAGLPRELVSAERSAENVSGEGTWRLAVDRTPGRVELVFERIGGADRRYRTYVEAERWGDATLLVIELDDEGFERYELRRP